MSLPAETIHPVESKQTEDVEIADIFRRHINDYQKRYKLHPDHFKVVSDIMECRTEFLGGHIHVCSECSHEIELYNSCGNRHCPKCQTVAKARWLESRKKELLPVPYFHTVFSLPHEINPLALCNKRIIYNLLFKSVSDTMLAFGKNPKNGLGGKLGLTGILHTWDQQLNDHIHLHCLVPGGVLSSDKSEFITGKDSFLFPVKALSKVFRAKFMEGLQDAFEKRKLKFPGRTANLETSAGFRAMTHELWSKEWVVYSKPPFSGPKTVLEYMARYTHRVAISNYRIRACEDGKVTFTWRDRRKNITKTMSLDAVEFIRRFLLHVVPRRFMRIRHFGLFANRCKKKNIQLCLELLDKEAEKVQPAKTVEDIMLELTGKDILCCPICKKGTLVKMYEIKKHLFGSGGYDFIAPP